jgi:hypothetical protein
MITSGNSEFKFAGYECSCGKYYDGEELEGHKRKCLPYLLNGMTGKMIFEGLLQPQMPVEFVKIEYSFPSV